MSVNGHQLTHKRNQNKQNNFLGQKMKRFSSAAEKANARISHFGQRWWSWWFRGIQLNPDLSWKRHCLFSLVFTSLHDCALRFVSVATRKKTIKIAEAETHKTEMIWIVFLQKSEQVFLVFASESAKGLTIGCKICLLPS